MVERFVVCRVEELEPGERKIVEVNARSIGVFNLHGSFHALRNVCPHQLAPLCLGRLTGTTLPSQVGEYVWGREGEIIRCPWHGWEFDVTTGRSIFNPHRVRIKSYPVVVEPAEPTASTCSAPSEEEARVETFPVAVEAGEGGDVVVLYV